MSSIEKEIINLTSSPIQYSTRKDELSSLVTLRNGSGSGRVGFRVGL